MSGGLLVSAIVSESSSPDSSPGRGYCATFLGETLYSHSASLHPAVKMGTGKVNAWGNRTMD